MKGAYAATAGIICFAAFAPVAGWFIEVRARAGGVEALAKHNLDQAIEVETFSDGGWFNSNLTVTGKPRKGETLESICAKLPAREGYVSQSGATGCEVAVGDFGVWVSVEAKGRIRVVMSE